MTDQKKLVHILNDELAIAMPEKISFKDLRETLSHHINLLIQNNFQKLVSILYRIDVDEFKLKMLLEENVTANSATIIADLIIERQLKKIESREKSHKSNDNIPNEEKW